MKIINLKGISSAGEDRITVTPENGDDIWVLYSVLEEGDLFTGLSTRKVTEEGKKTETFKLNLTICVERINYAGEDEEMHISGKIREQNKFAPLGSYHTITVKPKMKCHITKKYWDTFQQKILKESLEGNEEVNVAVLMIDKGSSTLYALNNATAKPMGHVSVTIPKNRRVFSKYDDAMAKFFTQTSHIINKLDLLTVRTLVVAGPGFTKNELVDWIHESSAKDTGGSNTDIKKLSNFLQENLPIIIKTPTATKSSLEYVLGMDVLKTKIVESKLIRQIDAMKEFQKTLVMCPDKACYGINSIEYALDLGAIDLLIVSDLYYRSPKPETRRRFTKIVEDAAKMKTRIIIAYRGHQTYDTVSAMGGFAAVLKWEIAEDEYPPEEP